MAPGVMERGSEADSVEDEGEEGEEGEEGKKAWSSREARLKKLAEVERVRGRMLPPPPPIVEKSCGPLVLVLVLFMARSSY